MLVYSIQWIEVAARLNLSEQTLIVWRQSDDVIKHEAIEKVVNMLIEEKKLIAK